MPGTHRRLACLALLSLPWTLPALATEAIFTAICEDRAGGQTFFIEQTERNGDITALKVAKVDHSGQAIERLLVFAAERGAIKSNDSAATSDLLLGFASDADAYQFIDKAHIVLATDGEEGPIIEDFRLQHANGEVLPIIEDSAPLSCKSGP